MFLTAFIVHDSSIISVSHDPDSGILRFTDLFHYDSEADAFDNLVSIIDIWRGPYTNIGAPVFNDEGVCVDVTQWPDDLKFSEVYGANQGYLPTPVEYFHKYQEA